MNKLSVIVTIYNIEKYLGRCLDSLVAQSMKEIEIICVNDGSTDSSPDILNTYHAQYPDLIVPFTKENGGGDWGSRNYGLKHVTTDYFVFVDGDDYVHPDFCLKLYNAITENDADMAVCAMDRIDIEINKKVTTDMNKFGERLISVDGKDSVLAFINPGPCNKVYRKSKVEGIEFEAIRGSCDLFFMLTAMPRLEKIALIPDALYYYMMRRNSQIFNIKQHDLDIFQKNFLKVKQLYTESASGQKLLDYLDLMVFIHFGISILYRLSYNSKDLKSDSRVILQFLNTHFKKWRKCSFLTFSYSIHKGAKHFCLYLVGLLYKLRMPLIFIRMYRFMIDKLHVDIKF